MKAAEAAPARTLVVVEAAPSTSTMAECGPSPGGNASTPKSSSSPKGIVTSCSVHGWPGDTSVAESPPQAATMSTIAASTPRRLMINSLVRFHPLQSSLAEQGHLFSRARARRHCPRQVASPDMSTAADRKAGMSSPDVGPRRAKMGYRTIGG